MNALAHSYKKPLQFIGGEWRQGGDGTAALVRNPATGEVLAEVPKATRQDLDEALAASAAAFETWRRKPAVERAAVLQRAAGLLRERASALAPLMTLEQGKTLAESDAANSRSPPRPSTGTPPKRCAPTAA